MRESKVRTDLRTEPPKSHLLLEKLPLGGRERAFSPPTPEMASGFCSGMPRRSSAIPILGAMSCPTTCFEKAGRRHFRPRTPGAEGLGAADFVGGPLAVPGCSHIAKQG